MAFALNHMTVPKLAAGDLIALAARLGCIGVEFRNDLRGELFGGASPIEMRRLAEGASLRILTLAEVKAFNDVSDTMLAQARDLMAVAKECGAEAISLIPRNDGQRLSPQERRGDLRAALRELTPLLNEHDLIGLIEPLGFETCALRDKAPIIEDIEAVAPNRFKLVHDTFHHHLAGGGPIFAAQTGLVHISGVTRPLPPEQMTDAHRGLVDGDDQLGNLDQLQTLAQQGYQGPISMEAFAPHVHDFSDPQAELARSFTFITQCLAGKAA